MYVEDVEDGKRTYRHIYAHNFLNIQPIFNPQKVLESWDLELSNHPILCILKHVEDVEDRSNAPKGCNAIYVWDVGDCNNLQYTQCLMVWLESPKSQLSKTFFGLKIH